MGFRFRKSINLGGARVNLSKSGVGFSVGGKGCRYTKKANGGTRTTASIPGTGISYSKESGKAKSGKARVQATTGQQAAKTKPNYKLLWILFRVLSISMIGLGLLLLLVEPVSGAVSIAIGIVEWVAANHYKKLNKKG